MFTLTVNALDHAGTFGTGTITINLNDVNEVPTDIAPNGFAVNENTDTSGGYSLGSLTTSDVDAGDSFSYSIVGGADQAKFSIGGAGFDELILTDGTLDFENQSSYQVTVRTTDAGGLTYDETLTVTVNDLNEAPVITSDGGGATASVNVAENTTAVTTVTATDEDLPGDTLTYSISGGTDAAKFSINSSTGALTFTIAPDRENPTDANSDAVYEVTVQVSDGTLADSQAISVTVTPVNEHTPTITSDGAVRNGCGQRCREHHSGHHGDGDGCRPAGRHAHLLHQWRSGRGEVQHQQFHRCIDIRECSRLRNSDRC